MFFCHLWMKCWKNNNIFFLGCFLVRFAFDPVKNRHTFANGKKSVVFLNVLFMWKFGENDLMCQNWNTMFHPAVVWWTHPHTSRLICDKYFWSIQICTKPNVWWRSKRLPEYNFQFRYVSIIDGVISVSMKVRNKNNACTFSHTPRVSCDFQKNRIEHLFAYL